MNKEFQNKEVEVLEEKTVEITSETQEARTEQEGISVQEISKPKKKGVLKWIVLALAAIIAAVCVGGYVYTNSPSYLAGEQLDLGEKYLADLDYEQAIVSFKKALEIDPNNAEIRAAIEGHIEEFYQVAREYGKAEEYASEKEIASFILYLKSDSVHGKIADAEADCGMGELEKAKQTYEEVRGGGVDEDDVEEGIQYCEAILQLLAYCEAKQWETALKYAEGEEITSVIEKDVTGERIIHTGNVTIAFGNIGNGRYVYCGDIADGVFTGNGVGMVSSANTYAIYEGAWSADKPNGSGTLKIWKKSEFSSKGNVYAGSFAEGVVDGTFTFETWVDNKERKTFDLSAAKGAVSVYQTDEKGNVWLVEMIENGCAYVMEYVTENAGVIADYVAGLPEFGGSDQKLSVTILDVEPPVITCDRVKGKSYDGGATGRGITAIDNVDGDVTEKIVAESIQTANSNGYNNGWWYGKIITYTVTDEAGNSSSLKVTYDIEDACGWLTYMVVSIK